MAWRRILREAAGLDTASVATRAGELMTDQGRARARLRAQQAVVAAALSTATASRTSAQARARALDRFARTLRRIAVACGVAFVASLVTAWTGGGSLVTVGSASVGLGLLVTAGGSGISARQRDTALARVARLDVSIERLRGALAALEEQRSGR